MSDTEMSDPVKQEFDNSDIVVPQTLRELPEEQKGVLEISNPLPLDSVIDFQEEGHKYFVNGVDSKELGYKSVTTIIGAFFDHFDGDLAVRMITRSKKHQNDPSYRYYKMSPVEIKNSWKRVTLMGSRMHANAEYYLNRLPVEDDSVEFKMFLDFMNTLPSEIKPFRTELLVIDEEYRIAGSIDALFKNEKTGTYSLVDWKRSRDVSKKGGTWGHVPLHMLKSNNYTKYSMQLSLYRNILERRYGLVFDSMYLVICHPVNNNFIKMDLPYLKDEVLSMLEFRRLRLMAQGVIEMPKHVAESAEIDWGIVMEGVDFV